MSGNSDQNPTGSGGGGDTFAQMLNDGQAGVTLWGSFLQMSQLTAHTFSASRAKRDSLLLVRKQMKQQLGPWYDLLVKDDELYRRPVLRTDIFLAYLQDHDAVLYPQGQCTATAGWAVFLHALGIEPGTTAMMVEHGRRRLESVISYSPLEFGAGQRRSDTTVLWLQMTGNALCHVVNLFSSVASPAAHGDFSASTAFGDLEGALNGACMEVRFHQADTDSVCKTHEPFGAVSRHLQRGMRWQTYLNTLDPRRNVSTSSLIWPYPIPSIKERLRVFRRQISDVERWNYFSHEDHVALIISQRWLDGANRLGLRVTSNGGTERTFLDDARRNLNRLMRADRDRVVAIRALENGFMFRDGHPIQSMFQLCKMDLNTQISPCLAPHWETMVRRALLETVSSYRDAAQDTWERQLFYAQDEVIHFIMSKRIIKYNPYWVHIVPYWDGPDCPIWNATVILR